MSITTDVGTAHAGTARMGIREIVRVLNAALGATLVGALAGSKDRGISYKWQRDGGPEPKPEHAKRLQVAHRAWKHVSDTEGEHVARLWFIGANPWLGEDSPIDAIREDRFREVMAAATAMIENRFSG